MRCKSIGLITTLMWASASLLFVSCSTVPPHAAGPGNSPPQSAAPPPPPPYYRPAQEPPPQARPETAPSPAAASYPRYGDSDDYVCNNGPPEEARTVQACARLRGPGVPATLPGRNRFGDSDDFVCNHGPPGEARTVQACQRLRGPSQ